jgi:glycosyltransferase involved in cell wall biosynthesis
MKTVLISSTWGKERGGSGNSAWTLSDFLQQQGIDTTVITVGRSAEPVTEIQNGVRVIRFWPRNLYPLETRHSQPAYKKVLWQIQDQFNRHAYQTVRSLLSELKPDIVHIHKIRGLSPSVIQAAAEISPGHVILTVHDYEMISPQGTLTSSVGKWAYEGRWFLRPYQKARIKISDSCPIVTAPSQFTLDAHTRRGYFSPAQKLVVPNTHGYSEEELAEIRRAGDSNHSADFRFLYLGRLEPEKGVLQMLDAFNKLSKENPRVNLEIAGWGSLEWQVVDAAAHNRAIHYHGTVFDEAKYLLIREADVMIVPSTWYEVFGIVIIEAYAFGKPVIASRIGGIPEIVHPGQSGWLVSPGSVSELVEAMRQAASSRSLPEYNRENLFALAENYTPRRIFRQFLDLYTQLTGIVVNISPPIVNRHG